MRPIEQDDVIEQHGTKSQELAAAETLDGHLAALCKEVFEQTIERFDRLGAQWVKHTADCGPTLGGRVRAPARGHQCPVVAFTLRPQVWGVVLLIAQDRADLGREWG